jgi:hypothetical protein
VTAGLESPFDKVWRAHWAYDRGHSLGNPPPPKLMEGVLLFETEIRARRALIAERIEKKAKGGSGGGSLGETVAEG